MASLKNRKLLDKIEAKLNFKFNNRLLLQQALTHKSFPNENRELNLKDNERLEFLGDSVLSLTISTHIFKEYPDFSEGKLAKMRAFLVSAPTLATKARQLELGSYILMGKGEEMTGGRERDSILADTLEALIGALYIDRDFEQASQFILGLFSDDINKVASEKYIRDYKTTLQEILQQNSNQPPDYRVIKEKGPDHNKTFVVTVNFKDDQLGQARGSSKKEAEQRAARVALKNLNEL